MKNALPYALAAGALYLWWNRAPAAPSAAEDKILPQITPVGAPQRTADNPLSTDEKQALAAGQATMTKEGWLKYVGYDDKGNSGSVGW